MIIFLQQTNHPHEKKLEFLWSSFQMEFLYHPPDLKVAVGSSHADVHIMMSSVIK